MRGTDHQQSGMFSYISAERREAEDHPLRAIRTMVDVALRNMGPQFETMYAKVGRRSIPPEKLLRALLLQVLYTVRSERMLMEQLDYNLLFRWFVGLNIDDRVWDATVFTRIASGCCAPRLPRPSLPRCWPRPAAAACSRLSTSRSTAR